MAEGHGLHVSAAVLRQAPDSEASVRKGCLVAKGCGEWLCLGSVLRSSRKMAQLLCACVHQHHVQSVLTQRLLTCWLFPHGLAGKRGCCWHGPDLCSLLRWWLSLNTHQGVRKKQVRSEVSACFCPQMRWLWSKCGACAQRKCMDWLGLGMSQG